jgi:guanylate kinase
VEENIKEGIDSLLVIDVQGAFEVKRQMPEATTVFLLPPSMAELERRITNRGFIDDNLRRRLSVAEREIPCAKHFDYVIINDFIDRAVEYLRSIILSSRCSAESFFKDMGRKALDSELIHLIKEGKCYVKEA